MASLHWIGKEAVVGHHREVPYHLLRGDPALSVGEDGGVGSGNLLVQGDNLLALKALLPYYAGRVKCIYIDPPYNTGNEGWVYNDNVNSPESRQWIGKVVGKEGETLDRHDRWLCMMYPRLALLREFLTEDGAIFVSIDDDELGNLLHVLDEVFGRARRVAVFTWVRKKKGSNLSKEFRKTTEYVVCYRGGSSKIELYGVPAYAEKQVPLLNRTNPVSRLRFEEGQVRVGQGVKDGTMRAQTFGDDEGLQVVLHNDVEVQDSVITSSFEISGRFRWGQPLVNEELSMGSVFTASKTFRINVARHDQGSKFKALASLISPDDGVGTNEDATEELRAILGDAPEFAFDYPKPTSLIRYLVNAACKSARDAIVLDSFAGSGTTGHAVLAMNKADGGNRRFICIEMDEKIATTITRQRLAKVIEGYHPGGDTKKEKVEGTGGGFRYVTLGEPLFNERGQLRSEVRFADLAAHVFFTETGEPLPKKVNGKRSPLIGVCRGTAYYLLFNGILGDKRPDGGNVLTGEVLGELPKHDGPRVVFGEACRLGAARLKREGVTFRQIPYQIKVS